MAEVSIGAALGKSSVNASSTLRTRETDAWLVVEKLEGSTVALRNDGLEGDLVIFPVFQLV